MKLNLRIYGFFMLFLVVGISACCNNDDAPPLAAIEFALYNNNGEDNLFDEDGPYSINSLKIFEEDGNTAANFDGRSSDGAFYLFFTPGSEDIINAESTYFLHLPNAEVDTLVGFFNFQENRCNSFWTFDKLLFNGQSFTERDDNGLIKLLRE